jgi:hypothetical protein
LAKRDTARTYTFNVGAARQASDNTLPVVVEELSREPGVSELDWHYLE